MAFRQTIFGRQKAKVNTFIGGVGTTLNTPELIAARLGISSSRIKAFKIVGTDIQFAVTGGTYAISNSAFSGNTSITYFDDRNGLVIGTNFGTTFYQAVNLLWINFPNLTVLGYRFASGCTSLTTVSFSSLLDLSSECFTGCSSLVNVGTSFQTVTKIGNVAFQLCSSLVELNFPNVGLCDANGAGGMFGGMSELVTLYAPNLTLVPGASNGGGMFLNCPKLENITLTSLNFLPREFVRNCVKIVNLNLPSVTSGSLLASFANTPLLETLKTPNLSSLLATYQGFLSSGVKNIDLSKVTDLSVFANETFQGTTRLETIDMRSGVTSIGASASVNNSVFNLMKTGVTITVSVFQKTINSGSPEPDLQFAISNRAATVIYQSAIIAGAYGSNYQKSLDNGVSFSSGGYISSTRSVTMSTNNKYVLIAHNTGVVLSTDFGKTFTNTGLTAGIYYSTSMSDTGQYMLVSASSGSTYLSNDYGATWNLAVPGGRRDCFVSSTGQYMLATYIDGPALVRSTDYGVSWTQINSLGTVVTANCSDNGQYITAVSSGSTIKVSNDGGLTWTNKTAYGNFIAPKVSMSADGKYQTVVSQNKYIHISSDYGVTWAVNTNTFNNIYYTCVDMSKDGKIQATAVSGGYIYVSSDFGTTWIQKGIAQDYQGITVTQ